VLATSQEELRQARARAVEAGCDIIDFPVEGQQTTDYQAFLGAVAAVETDSLWYVGVGLVGEKKPVRRITSKLKLLT
jgi:hypothetical protein